MFNEQGNDDDTDEHSMKSYLEFMSECGHGGGRTGGRGDGFEFNLDYKFIRCTYNYFDFDIGLLVNLLLLKLILLLLTINFVVSLKIIDGFTFLTKLLTLFGFQSRYRLVTRPTCKLFTWFGSLASVVAYCHNSR